MVMKSNSEDVEVDVKIQKVNGTNLHHVIMTFGEGAGDGCEVCMAHPSGVVTADQVETCNCPMCADYRANR